MSYHHHLNKKYPVRNNKTKPDYVVDGVPVFKPNMQEFSDFHQYVQDINHYGMESGIVKVIPPQEWVEMQKITPELLSKIQISNPIEQNISSNKQSGHPSGIFITNIEKNKKYNIIQWKELSYDYPLPSNIVNDRLGQSNTGSNRSDSLKRATTPTSQNTNNTNTKGKSRSTSPIRKRNSKITSKKIVDFTLEDFKQFIDNKDYICDEDKVENDCKGDDTELSNQESESIKKENTDATVKIENEDEKGQHKETESLFHNPDKLKALEEYYWKTILLSTPMYGADSLGSLFDPKMDTWNVSKLPNLLDELQEKIPGVTQSYLYAGLWKATFSWHLEDQDLHSINYLHFGAPKQWYSIPQQDAESFYNLMKELFPNDYEHCKEFLRHKTFHCNPKFLQEKGLKVNKIVHYPNEFIITYPYGYHSGFNYGYNLAESVNFAIEDWINLGLKAENCKCIDDSVSVNVQKLKNIVKENKLKRQAVQTLLDASKREELPQRKKLRSKGNLFDTNDQSNKTSEIQPSTEIKQEEQRLRNEYQKENKEPPANKTTNIPEEDENTKVNDKNTNIKSPSSLHTANDIMKSGGTNTKVQLPALQSRSKENDPSATTRQTTLDKNDLSGLGTTSPATAATATLPNAQGSFTTAPVISRLSSPLLTRIFSETDPLLDFQKKTNGPNSMLTTKNISSPLSMGSTPFQLSKIPSATNPTTTAATANTSNLASFGNTEPTANGETSKSNASSQIPSLNTKFINSLEGLPSPTFNLFKNDSNQVTRFNTPSNIPKLNLNSNNGLNSEQPKSATTQSNNFIFKTDSNNINSKKSTNADADNNSVKSNPKNTSTAATNGSNANYNANILSNKNVALQNGIVGINNKENNTNNADTMSTGSSFFNVDDDEDNMLALSLASMANSRISSPRLNFMPLNTNNSSAVSMNNFNNNTGPLNNLNTPFMMGNNVNNSSDNNNTNGNNNVASINTASITNTKAANSPLTNYFNSSTIESDLAARGGNTAAGSNNSTGTAAGSAFVQPSQPQSQHNVHPNHPINQLLHLQNGNTGNRAPSLISPRPNYSSINSLPSLGLSNSGTPIVGQAGPNANTGLLNQHNSLLTTATTQAAAAAAAQAASSSNPTDQQQKQQQQQQHQPRSNSNTSINLYSSNLGTNAFGNTSPGPGFFGSVLQNNRGYSLGFGNTTLVNPATSTSIPSSATGGIIRPKSPQSPYLVRGRSPNRVMLNISRDGSPLSSFHLNNPNGSTTPGSTNLLNLMNPHQPSITTSLSQIIADKNGQTGYRAASPTGSAATNNFTKGPQEHDIKAKLTDTLIKTPTKENGHVKKRKYTRKNPTKKQLLQIQKQMGLDSQNQNQLKSVRDSNFAVSQNPNTAPHIGPIGVPATSKGADSFMSQVGPSEHSNLRSTSQGIMSAISPVIPNSDALLSAQRYNLEPHHKNSYNTKNNSNNSSMISEHPSPGLPQEPNQNNSFSSAGALTGSFGSLYQSTLLADSVDIPTNENELNNANLKVQDDEVVVAEDGVKSYVCLLCDKSFSSGHHLTRHKNSVHCEAKPFSCPKCGKPFKRRDHVLQHLNKKIPCTKNDSSETTTGSVEDDSAGKKVII